MLGVYKRRGQAARAAPLGTQSARISRTGFLVAHSEALLQERARRRVLQVRFFAGPQVFAYRKGRQRSLVEARQDEFLLARVVVDIADRKNAGRARLEARGIDTQRLAVEGEPPLGDRAELRMQTPEDEEMIERHRARHAIGAAHVHTSERTVALDDALHETLEDVDLPGIAELEDPPHRGGRSTILAATMDEDDAACLAGERECPVERRVAAAENDEVA